MHVKNAMFAGILLACFQLGAPVQAVVLADGRLAAEPGNALPDRLTQMDTLVGDGLLEAFPAAGLTSGEELERLFRQKGDPSILSYWAPKLLERHPEDKLLHALQAVALAVSGKTQQAQKSLERAGSDAAPGYRYLAEALVARNQGKQELALKLGRKALQAGGEHPFLSNLLGQLQLGRGDYSAARGHFSRAVELAPDYVAAHANLGATEYLLGNPDAAITAFSQAIRLSPSYCKARIGRAVLAEESGDLSQAIHDLKTCPANAPDYPIARIELARIYMLAGQLDKAEELAKEIAMQEPAAGNLLLGEIQLRLNAPAKARQVLEPLAPVHPRAADLLAYAYFLEGDTDRAAEQLLPRQGGNAPAEAGAQLAHAIFSSRAGKSDSIQTFEKLATNTEVGALARFLLANVLAARGERAAALKLWRQAEDFLPGFTVAGLNARDLATPGFARAVSHLNAGVLLYIKGLYRATIEELAKGLQEDPASPLGHYFMALAYLALNKRQQALAHLHKTLEKAASFFPANYLAAEILASSGKLGEAATHLEAATQVRADAGALIKLGILQQRLGHPEKAEAAYQGFIKRYPDNFIGYNQLAWLYASRGKKLDKALKLARQAERLMPGNAAILDTLGWIHFQKKNYLQALDYLQKAVAASNYQAPQLLYHLAEVQHALGQDAAARANLEKALKLAAYFEGADKARQLHEKLLARRAMTKE